MTGVTVKLWSRMGLEKHELNPDASPVAALAAGTKHFEEKYGHEPTDIRITVERMQQT